MGSVKFIGKEWMNIPNISANMLLTSIKKRLQQVQNFYPKKDESKLQINKGI